MTPGCPFIKQIWNLLQGFKSKELPTILLRTFNVLLFVRKFFLTRNVEILQVGHNVFDKLMVV